MADQPQPEYAAPRPPRDIPHLLLPKKRKISHWNDRHEIRVNNWIEPFGHPHVPGRTIPPTPRRLARL
jgi:hypothetical protein